MRFGLAATMAIMATASVGATRDRSFDLRVPNAREEPLPSVANKVEHTRGMNAAQLEAMSRKNARRKRRR